MTDTFEYLLLNGPAKGARAVVPSARQTSLVVVGYHGLQPGPAAGDAVLFSEDASRQATEGLLTLSARAVAYQEDTP